MKMYKFGDQCFSLEEIFSVSDAEFIDGCTIQLYISSKSGARVCVKFKDNSGSGDHRKALRQEFIEQTKQHLNQLVLALSALNS